MTDMANRSKLLAAAMLLGLAGLVAHQAHAGLLGAGNTVQAFYYNGTFASPEGEDTGSPLTSDPASLAAPVNYVQAAADGPPSPSMTARS
jgi:hypothetical protein